MLYQEPTRQVVSKLGILSTIDNAAQLEDLAHEAFQNKGGELWRELQRLLYGINIRMMDHGFGLGKHRAESDWKIRNVVERVEQAYLARDSVPPFTQCEPFLVWLKQRIAAHRVNAHPLFDYFDRNDISQEECRYFLSNYRVNMQRFHLHVAAYSLIVPFQMRQELYDNLHDEFGQGTSLRHTRTCSSP